MTPATRTAPSGTTLTSAGVADRLAAAVRPFIGGDLPVRLQAWDGSVAGPAGAPLVVLRSPDALRRLLWHPGELGAAQAYVTGELDVPEQDGWDLGSALAHAFAVGAERGLPDRGEIRLQDYREVPERDHFDAVGSLEMGEHVGARNYPTYVEVLRRSVRPGGRVLVQQMSRQGAGGGKHPGGGPFIESFIAPDMTMRPVGETVGLIEAGGLEVRDVHAMREHYVLTVAGWMANFEANLPRLRELVGEEVVRVWRLYLVGGALAFRDGRMGVDQVLAVRPGGPHTLPAVRAC